MIESDHKSETQTAYQVLVSGSKNALDAGKGDIWDSGKVTSDQSIHIPYAGRALTSGERCYWRVRVWDKDGNPGPWSKTAFWTMGLLHPEDWKAKWIARETVLPPQSQPMKGAKWIWFPEGEPIKEAPAAARWFRKSFDIDQNRSISSANIAVTADNSSIVFINGHEIGRSSDWRAASEFDITEFLTAGANTIAIRASNDGGPAGLIAKATIEFQTGNPITIVTDAHWKSADAETSGWNSTTFDDSTWKSALELGDADTKPWGSPRSPNLNVTPAPLLRKTFDTAKPIKRATAYICGLGFYELHLNGHNVDDTVLKPNFTRYDKRSLYITHDVTSLLHQGKNAIGVILGNGWYNCPAPDAWDFDHTPWRGTPRLLMQLDVEYADGSHQLIVSDETWKTSTGPITFDAIRNGESYDARLEKPGWDTPNYSDSAWELARIVEGPTGELVAQKTLPNKVAKIVTPVKVTEPKPGIFVFDMGQNLAGWGRLTVSGPTGTVITIKYDERLAPDGLVDQVNASLVYGGNFQTDTYTLKGDGVETWEPRFTYHGFQYAQIEGFPGKPTVESLRACVVHTGFDQMGTFECSNDLLNHIQRNALWSYISNFVGYPTDCPHREKNGWTGDAHLAAEMGIYNFNPEANYTKWMDDFDDVQKPAGDFPGIVPTGGWGYDIGPSWDSAYLLIPWYMRLYCGDSRLLESHYDGIKRYIDYLTGRAENHIISYGLGDWCPPVGKEWSHVTPSALTSTAYYYIDVRIAAEVARMLGKTEDADEYIKLADEIKQAFNEKFYNPETGTYSGEEQTGMATALYQGLAPESDKDKIFASLLSEIKKHNDHLWCGILGTKYLLHVLTDNGRTDVAYAIATQRTFPSWGHWIEQGATTLWESWEGGGSRNHIMFGDISAWFYEALAGINPDPANPGFKHIVIHPHPVGDLTWARAEHKSMYGPIKSSWSITSGKLTLEIEIPANTTAAVYVPAADQAKVTAPQEAKFIGLKDGCATYEVGSGSYKFITK